MNILVDTSILSKALRRNNYISPEGEQLKALIHDNNTIYTTGIIIQEILQGIKSKTMFEKVKEYMSFFPYIQCTQEEHEHASQLFSLCRSKGIQTSTIDSLIASIAISHNCLL